MGIVSNTGPYNAAAEKFGIDAQDFYTSTPRLKYNFSVEFHLSDNVSLGDASFSKNFIFDRIANAGLPDVDYGIQTLNQYNRMRYVPTRMTISPFSISFYDTKDNQFQSLMKAYSNHYFSGHEMSTQNFNSYNVLNEQFVSGPQHEFGAKSIPNDSRFMFEKIRIHNRDFAEGGRTFTYFNCMMNAVNHDSLAYSDSQPILYQASFQPEHFNVGKLELDPPKDNAGNVIQTSNSMAGTVSNRPNIIPQLENNINTYGNAPKLRDFNGVVRNGEAIRNVNGKSYIVPAKGPQ